MAGWSRREVLAALAGAASAPAWASLLGCGGEPPAAAAPEIAPPPATVAGLRAPLRRIAADLARRYRAVAIRAELGRVVRVVVEPEGRTVDQRMRASLIMAGFDGSSWTENVTFDLAPEAMARAAEALLARAPRGRRRRPASAGANPSSATGEMSAPRLRIDPRARPLWDWVERVARLADRAARVGTSRVVYRVAALEVDDGEVLFLGDGGERQERLVRAQARALFLAWTGSALAAEEAVRAGSMGLEVLGFADDELQRAADGALTLLTGGQIASGPRDLLLDPSVAALFLRHGAARGFEGDAWARGGARAALLEGRAAAAKIVTLRDDPTAAGAYAGYRFDDEGWPAAPVSLIEAGAVRGPLCDAASAAALGRRRTGHGRRADAFDPALPRPSHLVLAPGARDRDQLVAAVGDEGYLIEGGVDGRGDPQSWRVAIRARRAREIARGRLTGRVYGPVVVAGDALALLAAVRALGRDSEVYGWREPHGSGELVTSVSTPGLVTRGWLGEGEVAGWR